MDKTVICPKDQRLLGEIDAAGNFLGTCPRCKCQYGVRFGKIYQQSSRQVTVQRQTKNQRGYYRYEYEFRILQPGGRLYPLEFSIPGQDDRLGVRLNDEVAIIFQADATGDVGRVLRVRNQTTGRDHYVASPKTGLGTAIILGGAVVFAGLVIGQLLPTFLGIPLFIAAIAGSVFVGKAYLKSKQVKLSPEQQRAVQQSRALLEEKTTLTQKLAKLEQELATAEEQFHRLKSLYERMIKADPTAYASRIQTLQAAGMLMESNIEALNKLVAEYRKTLEIIDIEYESGHVTKEFLSSPNSLVSQKLAELKQIEAQNADILAQLQANEEVRQLRKD